MAASLFWYSILLWIVGGLQATLGQSGLCNVFDAFKVQPDDAKFQLGGPFPLHENDCIFLNADTVQELVAIQWALTHWNQRPDNDQFRIALHARDTCSRRKEAVSQLIKFLDHVGYLKPKECANSEDAKRPILLGMFAPKDEWSAEAVAPVLRSSSVVSFAYNTAAFEALRRARVPNVVTTAPAMQHFIRASIAMLKELDSNMISVLSDGEVVGLPEILEQFTAAGISIENTYLATRPADVIRMANSDSKIIVAFMEKRRLPIILQDHTVNGMNKLLINISPKGCFMDATAQKGLLPKGAIVQLVVVQKMTPQLPEFRQYFLGVLRNNYRSYSLLASYMQQVFNCTMVGTKGYIACDDLSAEAMESYFVQAKDIDSVILSTYAAAAAATDLGRNRKFTTGCRQQSEDCLREIRSAIAAVDYTFDELDPVGFDGFRLSFRDGSAPNDEAVLEVNSILIEGIHLVNHQRLGQLAHKVLKYTTDSDKVTVMPENFYWLNNQPISSHCLAFKHQCTPCSKPYYVGPNTPQKISVSVPKQYDLFIAGFFDLHYGVNCDVSVDLRRYALPMAFVHTLWTLQQRFSHLKLLQNLEIGSLVVDSCSQAANAVRVASVLHDNCILLPGAGTNISITEQNTFGIVLTSLGQTPAASVLPRLPTVTLSSGSRTDGPNLFSSLPSYNGQAMAIVKLLQKQRWDFVSVYLSDSDVASVQAFEAFQDVARTHHICVAEVFKASDELARHTMPSTNVTLVLATAKDAALHFALQQQADTVFVVAGDAHDWPVKAAYDRRKALGTISIQPKQLVRNDMVEWLDKINVDSFPEPWFKTMLEEQNGCGYDQKTALRYSGRRCARKEGVNRDNLGRMTEAGYLARGVERLVFALDAAYKRMCPAQAGMCQKFFEEGKADVMSVLSKSKVDDEMDIYQYQMGTNGEPAYQEIGSWSMTDGLHLQQPIFRLDSRTRRAAASATVSTCQPPLCKCHLDADFFETPLHGLADQSGNVRMVTDFVQSDGNEIYGQTGTSKDVRVRSGFWKSRIWSYVFLGLNTLFLLLAVLVLVIISVKLLMRVVKGNQSLGICLLCGVILLYVTAYFYIFDPSDLICRLRYFMHPLSYAICFGVMIAKGNQLRNSESLGFDGSISYWNYWLLLFFIIGVQIALNLQWLLAGQQAVILQIFQNGESAIPHCNMKPVEFLFSQAYVCILLAICLFIASLNRNIKRNYKETKWLIYTSILCVPLFVVWMTAYMLVPDHLQDTVIVLELICCATVILTLLFGPKLYILLSYEPVLIEYPPGYKATVSRKGSFATQHNGNVYDVFERDNLEENGGPVPTIADRAVSPASSSGASTKSTGVSSGAEQQSPVFQAVVRKKSRSKRIKAANRDAVMAMIGGGVGGRGDQQQSPSPATDRADSSPQQQQQRPHAGRPSSTSSISRLMRNNHHVQPPRQQYGGGGDMVANVQ